MVVVFVFFLRKVQLWGNGVDESLDLGESLIVFFKSFSFSFLCASLRKKVDFPKLTQGPKVLFLACFLALFKGQPFFLL